MFARQKDSNAPNACRQRLAAFHCLWLHLYCLVIYGVLLARQCVEQSWTKLGAESFGATGLDRADRIFARCAERFSGGVFARRGGEECIEFRTRIDQAAGASGALHVDARYADLRYARISIYSPARCRTSSKRSAAALKASTLS